MLAWINANVGTLLVCLALAAVVACIITVLVRDKKKGKSPCGGSCGRCPMGGACCRAANSGEKKAFMQPPEDARR